MADNNPDVSIQVVSRGREFVEYSDGSQWTRKLDETGKPRSEWTKVETSPGTEEPAPSTRELSVVARHQAEGEPKHWCLFSHRPKPDGTGCGQAWQVTGDAEYMRYQHDSDIDILNSEEFAWHQVLNSDLSDSQFATVDRIVRAEPAPRAVNRAAVTENCQGWVIRVLQRLAGEDIVAESAITALQESMDPVRTEA